eukprot:418591_1
MSSKQICMKHPNAVDPSWEISGNGTHIIKEKLKEFGFGWNKRNRSWDRLYQQNTVMKQENVKERKAITKAIKKSAKNANIHVKEENNNDNDIINNSNKRIRRPASSRNIDESLKNDMYEMNEESDIEQSVSDYCPDTSVEIESESESDIESSHSSDEESESESDSYMNPSTDEELEELEFENTNNRKRKREEAADKENGRKPQKKRKLTLRN